MSRSDLPDAAPYPVWTDSCWISMAAQSADGTGPRVGRLVSRDTNCPDGQQQRVCHPLGFWERNVSELELRVLLGPGEDGVCQVIVEETKRSTCACSCIAEMSTMHQHAADAATWTARYASG